MTTDEKLEEIGRRFRETVASQSFDGHAIFMAHMPVESAVDEAAFRDRRDRMVADAEIRRDEHYWAIAQRDCFQLSDDERAYCDDPIATGDSDGDLRVIRGA